MLFFPALLWKKLISLNKTLFVFTKDVKHLQGRTSSMHKPTSFFPGSSHFVLPAEDSCMQQQPRAAEALQAPTCSQSSWSSKSQAAPFGKVSQEPRWITQPSGQGLRPTLPKQGKRDRHRDGGQVQPRAQIIKQYHGDDAGPRSSWEVSPWVRSIRQVHSDKAEIRAVQEVSLRINVHIKGFHRLELSWRPVLLQHSSKSK